MGKYLNPGGENFYQARNSRIYVDKSRLIEKLNGMVRTTDKYICVSRPRRFGKSMTADMIAAYYDRTVDAAELFKGLAVMEAESFAEFANHYDVVALNMQKFLSQSADVKAMLQAVRQKVIRELRQAYPDVDYEDATSLSACMADIFAATRRHFVIVIDEWDCIFREYKDRAEDQRLYLDFLRDWLKDSSYVGLAYMTGILPIKKYGTHSALNMFNEFSMTNARQLAEFTGFTAEEVKHLCRQHQRDFETMKYWYDGYRLVQEKNGQLVVCEIYNPRSVVISALSGLYDDYWNQTEAFDSLQVHIAANTDGLRDAILALMAGNERKIDIRTFKNGMSRADFSSYEDILTLLVHLGYLAYDWKAKSVFIPNKELMDEFVSATSASDWSEIINSVKQSDALLEATWSLDAEAVAKGIEAAHFQTSQIDYNSEAALSYTVSLAYYSARQYYNELRELPAGKGFADIVFLPRPRYAEKPALIVELKWNRDAKTAIRQIKDRQYVKSVSGFAGKAILIGISYDKETKEHQCEIEEIMLKCVDAKGKEILV